MDTPRTNNSFYNCGKNLQDEDDAIHPYVRIAFARQLERELTALKNKLSDKDESFRELCEAHEELNWKRDKNLSNQKLAEFERDECLSVIAKFKAQQMTEAKAREVLAGWAARWGDGWSVADGKVCFSEEVDFTPEELRAIAWRIDKKKEAQS